MQAWTVLGCAFWLALGSLHAAHADDIADCVTGTIVLPLLGGRTDAPIIPVRVEGHDAAMYLSPDFSDTLVRSPENWTFDGSGPRHDVSVDSNGYHHVPGAEMQIDDLQVGGADVGAISATKLRGAASQTIEGRPIVGLLGNTFLSNSLLLLDMPEGKLVFFTTRQNGDCADVAQRIMGAASRSVPMKPHHEIWNIPISIDGQMRDITPDTDLAINAIPSSWADVPELAPDVVAKGEFVKIDYMAARGAVSDGRRITLHGLPLGGMVQPATSVIVHPDLGNAILGLPFFINRIVLFDFRNRRFFFLPEMVNTQPLGHHLHFEQAVVSNTSVREAEGKPQ
ncbi:hypothetical protein [Tanticharoenia sakaeratensis]|uniref:Aspartyl protease n=1 Tax=Tanticharoenia sakaeratensis NBRC 103193 TaxID=1231623 RepID=A0A0D6MNY3_9PROT|nr:hypothetical protein [Tanticharoenia sakaeratensis]GAN55156.1 hypothetical protein Tasa_038_137 [Tanticharoenia sakaeratensis NBRC 103193]GBQ20373.1 hypothetical protein AA103193_1361 [Tanticharoenia sakaeratensis NBRC 103193]